MHLAGYLYEDYHDAQSLEHKVTLNFPLKLLNILHFGLRS
jgi:hypothetical protein